EIRAAKHACPPNAEFKIGCGFKVDLETVDQGLLRQSPAQTEDFSNGWILSVVPVRSGHFANPVLGAEWPQQFPQNPRKFRWMRLINAEHVKRLSVVAPQERILRGT